MKFVGNLKYIFNKILGILEKNFENFVLIIILKLNQFQYNLLKFWSRFRENFLEI